MRRDLALARKALGLTWPNPPVGCFVLNNGKLVGQGFHAKAGEAHAEVAALEQAGSDAKGGELHVSLEPCSHHGRTPPCTDLIIKSGIKKVVIGARDPINGGAKKLAAAGLEVSFHQKSGLLHLPWLFYNKYQRPLVVAKVAKAIDGAIGGKKRLLISGPQANRLTGFLRSASQAIIVGSGTANADNPSLRAPGEAQPTRIVVGRNLLGSRACLQQSPGRYMLGEQTQTYPLLEDALAALKVQKAQMVLIEPGAKLFNEINTNVLADIGIVYSSPKRFDTANVFIESFGSDYDLAYSEQKGDDLVLVFVKKGISLLEHVFRNYQT